jgi:hypothetical protein
MDFTTSAVAWDCLAYPPLSIDAQWFKTEMKLYGHTHTLLLDSNKKADEWRLVAPRKRELQNCDVASLKLELLTGV